MQVGVILPSAEDRFTGHEIRYADIRRWALRAEELGFDCVWIYDHLLVRRQDVPQFGVWEGWTLISALAEATTRVELGTWVICASWRSPTLLAKMAVTLDEVSGGRLILGIGAGNQKPEFDAFGFDWDGRIGRFDEAVQIIAPLIREGHVDFQGRFHQAIDCDILPRGPRTSGPPILIGADGPRMMRLAAAYADLWTCTYLGDPARLAEPLGRLHDACRAINRDPASIGVTVGEWIVFRDLNNPAPGVGTYIDGSVDRVAGLLAEYEQLGVTQVMLQCPTERYDDALERLGEAMLAYRKVSPGNP